MSSVGTTCLAEGTNHYKTYGGRQAKYKKKTFAQGKIIKRKKFMHANLPQKIFMLRPKKN